MEMKSPDADYRYAACNGATHRRYMALNDLVTSLTRDSAKYAQMDERLEAMVVQQVLELLGDKNTEVKNLTVTT